MFVKNLKIINFKNHSEKSFDFSADINCFVGNNGAGKTNILDALHYISMGKSFLGISDFQNIKENEDFFNIEAEIESEEKSDISRLLKPMQSTVYCYTRIGNALADRRERSLEHIRSK